MEAPFYKAIARLAEQGPRFYVPGHKGNPAAFPELDSLARWDMTEIEGACDLSAPSGPLAESEANMARLYASGASLYSAAGTSSCVQAMLALFAGAGGRVVAARGCHVSAVRAMALMDLEPCWVPLYQGRPQPEAIEAALKASGAGCVYITSPDYYGRMADIPALAEVCHRQGAQLLCDNAHGAHLRFMEEDTHPLTLGADASVDSAHKTLPCLTPAALFHLRNGSLAGEARRMLNLFSSTSPSYPVLLSLDLAAGRLLAGEVRFASAQQQVSALVKKLAPLCAPCNDPLRLCLVPRGRSGYASLLKALAQEGIAPEYADGQQIVLMASPYNTLEDFSLLQSVLEQFVHNSCSFYNDNEHLSPYSLAGADSPLPLPKVACSIRTALFTPPENRQPLPPEKTLGRVAAGLCAPCPPGVPVIMPGEIIDKETVAQLMSGGILQIDVLK